MIFHSYVSLSEGTNCCCDTCRNAIGLSVVGFEVPAGRTDNAQLDVHLSHFNPHRRRWKIPGYTLKIDQWWPMCHEKNQILGSWPRIWRLFWCLGSSLSTTKKWRFQATLVVEPDLIPCEKSVHHFLTQKLISETRPKNKRRKKKVSSYLMPDQVGSPPHSHHCSIASHQPGWRESATSSRFKVLQGRRPPMAKARKKNRNVIKKDENDG